MTPPIDTTTAGTPNGKTPPPRTGNASADKKAERARKREFDRAAGDILRDAIQAKKRKPSAEELASQAKQAQNDDRDRHPAKYLTDADVEAVAARLQRAAYGLLAIHRLSIDTEDDHDGFYSVAIEQLARSAFKGIDACIARLTHQASGPIGNFEGEFDEPENVDQHDAEEAMARPGRRHS